MKRISLVFAILLTTIFQLGAQTRMVVKSEVKEVNVFLNQAQVIREASFSSGEGILELVFEKLSPQLNENSIELVVPDGVKIVSLSSKNDNSSLLEKPQEILAFEDSLERTNASLFLVQADKENIQLQRDLLLANKSLGGNSGVKAEELEDVLSIYEARLGDYKFRRLRLDQEENRLLKAKSELESKLNDYYQGKLNLSRQVKVLVAVEKSMPLATVQLKYLVGNVSWGASYDVRVNGVGAPIEFVLKANIVQSTGEDWDDVRLRLSGIDPSVGGSLPVLEPLFIYLQDPLTQKRGIPSRSSDRMENNTVSGAMPAMLADANMEKYQAPTVVQTPTALKFEVNIPSSIPSDGMPHRVELTRFSLPAQFKLMSIPKLEESVFVNAAVQANDILNQLNAEATIYYNGSFTGTTFISSQVNDTMIFTLGKEKRAQVSRVKLKEMSSKSMFGSSKKEKAVYEIKLVNSSAERLEIEIIDQIPVSTNGEMEVKLINAGGASYTAETGKLSWIQRVEPKQEIKLQFEFDVIYPSGKIISPF